MRSFHDIMNRIRKPKMAQIINCWFGHINHQISKTPNYALFIICFSFFRISAISSRNWSFLCREPDVNCIDSNLNGRRRQVKPGRKNCVTRLVRNSIVPARSRLFIVSSIWFGISPDPVHLNPNSHILKIRVIEFGMEPIRNKPSRNQNENTN